MRIPRDVGVMLVWVLCLVGVWPESLFGQGTTPDRTILLYQRILQRSPADARAYYHLGDAYIQKARVSGDITYIQLAEQALRKSLDFAPNNAGALRHLAYVLYSRHEFQEAAIQAAKAIRMDPADSHAYGILGDAYQEVGKYEQAQETYHSMIEMQEDLYSYGRLAGLKTLLGDTKGAIQDLERAIQEGEASGRPRESIAWAHWQLGAEHFTLGNLKEAETQYLAAFTSYPNYYRAAAGLAQVRAAQQRYLEAIDLYQKAMGIIPLPEYAAALGDLFMKIGRPEEAGKQYDLVEYIGQLDALNKVLYNRELSYFYADHDLKPEQALGLARLELEMRKDIYGYDVLAWALYKNGNLQEARTAMAEALKLGTKDAKLFFHAGMIHYRLGEAAKATEYLQRALSINPSFHLIFADMAEHTLHELKGGLSQAVSREQGDAE